MIHWQYHDYSLTGSTVDLRTFIVMHSDAKLDYEKRWGNAIAGDAMHFQMLYNRDGHLGEVWSRIFAIKWKTKSNTFSSKSNWI